MAIVAIIKIVNANLRIIKEDFIVTDEFDLLMLKKSVEISRNCPLTDKAYSVGALIVDHQRNIISTGFSRETALNVHAEEVAIIKAKELEVNLNNTTIYTSMEPCGLRLSGKISCAERIIRAGISRVVYGVKEPPFFVKDANGSEIMEEQGVIVEQIKEVIPEIMEINDHIK